MNIEFLFINPQKQRHCSRALKRLLPHLLALNDHLENLELPDEPLNRIIAMLATTDKADLLVHYGGSASKFSFFTGVGQGWSFRVSDDEKLLAGISNTLISAIAQSGALEASKQTLGSVFRSWATSCKGQLHANTQDAQPLMEGANCGRVNGCGLRN